jgi:starvation-inducible outer membrane lipoprotein
MRLLALVLLLAGCTTLPADPSNMTPEQLKAIAIDKNVTGSCVIARNMTGTVAMVFVNLDKTSIKSGSLIVKPGSDCETTITSEQSIVPAAKAASTPSN